MRIQDLRKSIVKLNITALASLKNRPIIFYVLAFAPLVLIVYYHPTWPYTAISPAYGFVLLLLKKQNFFSHHGPNHIQKALGMTIIFGSFFVYYALVPFFPRAAFYTVPNYATYIFGLLLTFFYISALKEAFTPMLLIVAATLNSLVFAWLEPVLSPYINHFVSLIALILRTFGLTVTTQYPDILVLHTFEGPVPLSFSWGCVASSSIVFSIILVVLLFEERTHLRTTFLWAVLGTLGTIFVNITRLTILLLLYHFYGFEVGEKFHNMGGYAMFITWLVIFFYMFSKRQAILRKTQPIWRKLSWISRRAGDHSRP